jgi:hypothetical protein
VGLTFNECCIQSENDLNVNRTFSFSAKKEMNVAINGSYSELAISWLLVFYEIYTKIEKCTTAGDIGRFFLSNSCFLHWGDHVVDFFGEGTRREVVGHVFSSGIIES